MARDGDQRRESRQKPRGLEQQVMVRGLSDDQWVQGSLRNYSSGGFSASFRELFPFEPGDKLDARVIGQRWWVRLVWGLAITDTVTLAGFEREYRPVSTESEVNYS